MYRACICVHLKKNNIRADKTKHYPRYIRVPLDGGRGRGEGLIWDHFLKSILTHEMSHLKSRSIIGFF